MDLSTGSIGWHRTRRWLDSELNRLDSNPSSEGLTDEQRGFQEGYVFGLASAYSQVRARFYTEDEMFESDRVRREMFG